MQSERSKNVKTNKQNKREEKSAASRTQMSRWWNNCDGEKVGGSTIYMTVFTFRQVGRRKSEKDLCANGTTMLIPRIGYLFFRSSGVARFWVNWRKTEQMCFSVCKIKTQQPKSLQSEKLSWRPDVVPETKDATHLAATVTTQRLLNRSGKRQASFPKWHHSESGERGHVTPNLQRLLTNTV